MKQPAEGSKKRVIVVAIIASFIALTGGLVYVWTGLTESGELGAKPGYAALQHIEFEHRSDPDQNSPLIVRNTREPNLTVLGSPAVSRTNPRQWLILDRVSPTGEVIRLPVDAAVRVDCAYVSNLQATERLHPEVVRYLKQVCK